jgi:hypothetical protein
MRHTLVFVLGCVLAACLTGCATAYGPRQVDDYATYAMWSRVGELRPGSEIEVATTNTLLRDRIFVSADAADVTVLSLDDPALPSSASRALRYMARRQPEHFAAMQTGSSLEHDRVRLGRDGLFVADRRIAAFADMVERLPRAAVREIRGPVVARGSVPGTILGAYLGFCVGVLPGLGGAKPGVAWTFITSSTSVGGWLGHRWSSHAEEGVIYRAP